MGYTEEQINIHLRHERERSKQSRNERKKNNEKNKELIAEIKKDLVGKKFSNKHTTIKVLSIRESVDGEGFWYKINKVFKDGSSGDFRYFYWFEEYSLDNFLKTAFY